MDYLTGRCDAALFESILHPEVQRVHTQFTGNNIHVSLDGPGGLVGAKTTIGNRRGIIGININGIYLDIGYLVGTASRLHCA